MNPGSGVRLSAMISTVVFTRILLTLCLERTLTSVDGEHLLHLHSGLVHGWKIVLSCVMAEDLQWVTITSMHVGVKMHLPFNSHRRTWSNKCSFEPMMAVHDICSSAELIKTLAWFIWLPTWSTVRREYKLVCCLYMIDSTEVN